MKKLIGIFVLMLILAFGSLGLAQNFGVYTGYGYDGIIGGQFYTGDLRISIGITPIAGIGISGSVDYIIGEMPISDEAPINFYYGVGAGAGFAAAAGASIFNIHGHGLGGISYDLPSSNIAIFGEVGLGPQMVMGAGITGFTFGYDVKFGAVFK